MLLTTVAELITAAVDARYGLVARYYRLKAKLLGLTRLAEVALEFRQRRLHRRIRLSDSRLRIKRW